MIRDHNGVGLTACIELRDEVTVPELVEALARRRTFSLAGKVLTR
jgi:hypothetical protein